MLLHHKTAADENFRIYWAIQQSKSALEESKQAHTENMEAIDNETDSKPRPDRQII